MAFAIDNEIKDRVRSSIDIADLLGGYMQLRRQGANYVGLCPFHEDRRPSLQINVARQIWKCWVCDLGGDVFSFLMQKEQLSFPEALAMLAERAGIELPKPDGKRTISVDNKRELFGTMAWVVAQYHHCLTNDESAQAARDYLAQRGINQESIAKFKIGFAPPQWNWLCDRFAATNQPLSLLDSVGVVAKSDRGSTYDRFRGRVIFPIADPQGRFVSMGGRLMPGEPDNQAKYVNCSETRLYQKNQQLYGLDIARHAIAQSRTAVVMEGYTDVIMANQFGIPNAVAVCGTALGEGHLRLLKRYCDQVILLLDGDIAGRKRANEILELFLGHSIDLRIVTLPDELDPCDFLLQRDVEPLRDLLSNAVDALEFKVSDLLGDIDPYQDTHRANVALEQVLELLAKASGKTDNSNDSTSLRLDQIVLRLAKRFGLETSLLRGRLAEHRKKITQQQKVRAAMTREKTKNVESHQTRSANDPLLLNDFLNDSSSESFEQASPFSVSTQPIAYKDLSAVERELFEILVQREDLVPLALERFDEQLLPSEAGKSLMRVYVECDFRGLDLDFNSVMGTIEDARMKSLLVSIESHASAKNARLLIDARERLLSLSETFSQVDLVAEQHRRMKMLESNDLDDSSQMQLLQDVLQAARENKTWKLPESL